MKIIHIIAGVSEDSDKAHVAALIAALAAPDREQIVVAEADHPALTLPPKTGGPITPIVLTPSLIWRQRWRLAKLIRREKPEVVCCWSPDVLRFLPRVKIPKIIWYGVPRDNVPLYPDAHYVAATEAIRQYLLRSGVPPDQAHFIPQPPALTPAPPIDRATVATPRQAKVILSLSRLHPHKGLDLLLQAAATMPDCYVLLAGEGPARPELERLAIKLGIADRVRFLSRRADRAALLRAADVSVVPSRHEASDAAFVETWEAGVPLVACRNALSSVSIADGLNGLLVPCNDPEALAAALRRAFTDRDLRQKLIAQGYATYIKTYTSEAVLREWASLINLYHCPAGLR